MINKKKQNQLAKALLSESLTEGLVDDKKVKKVVESFLKSKPAAARSILKIYKRLIERVIAKEQVTVESAQKLAESEKLRRLLIKKFQAKKIILRVNPKLVFGLRVKHADWIYESTLDSKLSQLTTWR